MHSCTAAICDKIRQSAEGAIQAVTEFVSRRGSQLNDNDISRYKKFCFHRRAIGSHTLLFDDLVPLILFEISSGRTTQSLLSAAVHITEKNLRVEAIGAVSFT